MTIDIKELRKVIADCYWPTSPVTINEILDRLEAAEKSDAESIAMYRKARDERDTLRAKIETAENDAAHQKALAASALRVAEGWERKCGELRAEVIYWKEQKEPGAAGWRALARILRAKIEQMEKQVPICRAEDLRHAEILLPSLGLMPEDKLYALPGAKAQNATSVPSEEDESVRKAWSRFSNELHRGPDAPYPGMSEAFEQHFSQSFTDRDWRAESGTWAAAWKAAKRHGAQPAPSVTDGWKEAAIAWEVCASIHREYGKGKDPFFNTRQGDFVKHANDARTMLAGAPEAKP